MKPWLLYTLLLSAGPVAAQRPTAEAAQPVGGFWPVGAGGAITFTAPAAQGQAAPLAQAEHVRAWLTRTCVRWDELQTGRDSVQAYRGQLSGAHPGVVLTFALRLARRPAGWVYRLGTCQVGAPTGQGLVQWLPLQRVLRDADFQPDVQAFAQQLQRALPTL